MMRRHGDPALARAAAGGAGRRTARRRSTRRRPSSVIRIGTARPASAVGHAVAIAADLDVGVPADLAQLPVRRVVAAGGKRLQLRLLPGEPLGHDLVHGAVHPRVGLLAQPLLGELIEMGPAVEGPVADEEVVLDVADLALVLALGPGPRRPTGARPEAVVAGEIEKPGIEARRRRARCSSTAHF